MSQLNAAFPVMGALRQAVNETRLPLAVPWKAVADQIDHPLIFRR